MGYKEQNTSTEHVGIEATQKIRRVVYKEQDTSTEHVRLEATQKIGRVGYKEQNTSTEHNLVNYRLFMSIK
ncbi:hypothetical protein CHS0354_034294 [Potamilus streckersoni]|uniref:Uncharacterized protein n=1 Tax=Potamilus streckersoni TaxID=2493646 RepID=A0AAE0W9K2_9BIVA|nr:hypothetical protein CHS0354_034294 [Potamilus streckersoni]